MRPKIIKLPAPSSRAPHTCIVTRRRDGEVVDFGVEAEGIEPHVYLRRELVETAAETCGMVRQKEIDELKAELAEANAEAGRLRAIVAGKESLSDAEDKLREILGPAKPSEAK